MGGDDRVDDREPEARGAAGAVAGVVPAREAAQERRPQGRGDAGPVVGDGEHDGVGVRGEPDVHVRAGRGVRAGVGEEVGQHLAQAGLVAGHLEVDGVVRQVVRVQGAGRRVDVEVVRAGQVERPVVVGSRGVRVRDGVHGEHGEVDGRAVERASGVEPGEEQQVLDEAGHAHGLGLDAVERARRRGRHVVGGAAHELGVPADGGERRAQLVARVGDEPPHLGLGVVARMERGLDVLEHPVERGAHLADLGALVGEVGRDAGDGVDLALRELELGDAARGGGDVVERAQRAPHEPGAEEHGREEPGRAERGLDEHVPLDRRVELGGARRDDHGLPVRGGAVHGAERPELGEVDVVRGAVGGDGLERRDLGVVERHALEVRGDVLREDERAAVVPQHGAAGAGARGEARRVVGSAGLRPGRVVGAVRGLRGSVAVGEPVARLAQLVVDLGDELGAQHDGGRDGEPDGDEQHDDREHEHEAPAQRGGPPLPAGGGRAGRAEVRHGRSPRRRRA